MTAKTDKQEMSVISGYYCGPTSFKIRMMRIGIIILVVILTVMASISEDGKANDGGSVKGPKHEMREKIQMIKKLLSEVSALAEICGGT